eukprot:Pgem_evm1s15331
MHLLYNYIIVGFFGSLLNKFIGVEPERYIQDLQSLLTMYIYNSDENFNPEHNQGCTEISLKENFLKIIEMGLREFWIGRTFRFGFAPN